MPSSFQIVSSRAGLAFRKKIDFDSLCIEVSQVDLLKTLHIFEKKKSNSQNENLFETITRISYVPGREKVSPWYLFNLLIALMGTRKSRIRLLKNRNKLQIATTG